MPTDKPWEDAPLVADKPWESAPLVEPPSGPAARYISNLFDSLNPIKAAKGIAGMIADPFQAQLDAAGAMANQWQKAGQAYQAGNSVEAAGHAVAGSIPLIGPAAAEAGEQIGSGDVAGGLGRTTGLVGSIFMPGVAGRVLRAPAAKVLAPLADAVDPEVAAAASRQGIEMPASALSESKVVPVLEGISAKGLGGAATVARRTAASLELASRADQLAEQASKLGSDASLNGSAIAKGFQDYRSAWIRSKNALYNDAAIPKDLTVDTTNTARMLDGILADKAGAARLTGEPTNFGMLKTLRDQLSAGQVSAADARAAIQELNGRIGGAYADAWSAANKGLLKKVAASLSDDFETGLQAGAPDVAAKLQTANAAYADGLSKINSAFGQTIYKLAKTGEYGKIAKAASSGALTVDNLPGIMDAVGPEATDAIRASVLQKIVGEAKNPSTNLLTPEGLSRAMDRFGRDRLQALLTPDQLSKLDDLSALSKSMGKGAKITEGSQTAYIARVGAQAGLAVAHPLLALKVLLGDYAFNRFIGSGFGQKWLTTGLRPVNLPTMSPDVAATGGIGAATLSSQTAGASR